jgi:Tol biopolymer transport system component
MGRHGKSASATITFGVASAVLTGIGCGGEDVTTPTTGSIEVTTVTGGPEPDPDGYAISIDNGFPSALGANATTRRDDVDAGEHHVQLSGIAANCSVQGANPRPVTVADGATVTVNFAVACTATSGNLTITTATTGSPTDPDGYTVAVDNESAQPIGVSGALNLVALIPGVHQVTLGGLASNCRVEGGNPRPVTVTLGSVATVAFSITCSGGSRIALVSTRDGNEEIYVMEADGSGVTRLTRNPESDFDPEWSPDGTRIAFTGIRDNNSNVYVMNADGSGVIRLTGNANQDGEATWSPNGAQIAFTSYSGGRADIYVMNVDGSGRTRLTSEGIRNSSPDWSPGGNAIAFVQVTEFRQEVMVMNTDGSGLAQLTHGNAYYLTAEWSPNGSKIAFTGYQDGPDMFGVVNADGTGETFFGGGGSESAGSPAWSGDGRLAYSKAPYYDEQEDHYPEDFEIYVVNQDEGGRVQLTNNSGFDNGSPDWSRDDRKIAFVRSNDRNSDIYIMNPDGTGQTQLTAHPARDYAPHWSP